MPPATADVLISSKVVSHDDEVDRSRQLHSKNSPSTVENGSKPAQQTGFKAPLTCADVVFGSGTKSSFLQPGPNSFGGVASSAPGTFGETKGSGLFGARSVAGTGNSYTDDADEKESAPSTPTKAQPIFGSGSASHQFAAFGSPATASTGFNASSINTHQFGASSLFGATKN
jgi:hypothetical protein